MFSRRRDPEPVYASQLWDEQHLVWPVQRALMAAYKDLEDWPRRPMLEVPRDYREPSTAGVVFWLPPWWHATADVRKSVVSIISSRLGITDPVATWQTAGIQPKVIVKPRARTPESVLWPQVRELAAAASPTAPVLGLGIGGAVVDCDLVDDSPHVAISAGSGGGKSTLVKAIVAQNLYHGGVAIILDFKRSSHRWAYGLENVCYARDLEDIHSVLVAVGQEAERRNVASDDPDADLGPRITLVAEEMNATVSRLGYYWENLRERGQPKTSPAIASLRDILFMGRSTGINCIAVAQMLTARAIGGPEARENFSTRCLTRYSSNSWKMLAPEAGRPPARSSILGRWQIVKAGTAHETQVMYLTDDEARDWASKGTGQLGQLGVPERSSTTLEVAKVPGHVPSGTYISLRDALAYLPGRQMTYEAAKKAAQRDPRFPEPVGWAAGTRLYDIDSLRSWKREKLAAIEAGEAS